MVWVPKKGATEKDVGVATRVVPDARALHYWDGSGATMNQLGSLSEQCYLDPDVFAAQTNAVLHAQ